ncbi:PIG-L family deacetylase, partial [bacterium]|nr:PIG-L family deacetylase [bacterium]
MSVDILAFGPHPDDVELLCGGTVAKLAKHEYSIGCVDMTRGELGTRGSSEERAEEAAEAARIIGAAFRENLDIPDGGINCRDYDQRHKVVEVIRKHSPKMVICPAAKDRHPDHAQ